MQIDDLLHADEPVTADPIAALGIDVRTLLTPDAWGDDFAIKYDAAVQQYPDVVLAHADVVTLLAAGFDRREIGHLHGDYQADLPFSARLRKTLVAAGQASPHHLYPNSGWVSFYIHSADDLPTLIELLKLNYDRLVAYPTQAAA